MEVDENKSWWYKISSQKENLAPTVHDVALIFEGGGMRESYSSGIANILMTYGLFFDYVSGISAGSSSTVNYLSRDILRTKMSFIDNVTDPNFGGVKTFLQGKGYFSSEYIYEIAGQEDGFLEFDFDTFARNPAQCVIGAFNADTGEMRYWEKDELYSLDYMMRVVRASSTLPVLMPPPQIEGHTYMDGGLRDSIPLEQAKKHGYEKFFVVLTRPKYYRKEEPSVLEKEGQKIIAAKWPQLQEAMATQYRFYNETLAELEQLEREGKAYLVCPQEMQAKNTTVEYIPLQQTYDGAVMQGLRDLPQWFKFLQDNIDPNLQKMAEALGFFA